MISISNILQYYAVMNLVLLPFSLLSVVYFKRKTDLIDRLDDRIDRFLVRKGAKPRENEPGPAVAETHSVPPVDVPETTPEENGVACFRLMVNDLYYCHLSSQYRDERIHALKWTCDNDFIGKVDDKAVFHGKKTGTVRVLCSRKDSTFEEGSVIYQIDVVPSDENWFASRFILDLLDRKPKDIMLVRNINRRIQKEIPGQGIVIYEGDGVSKQFAVQFDKAGQLVRGVYFLRSDDEKSLEEIRKNIEERLEPVPLKKGSSSIWIRRQSDEEKNEVDVYAVLKKLKDGTSALCIGQTWREYGEIEEFLQNVSMTEKMFRDLLPGEPFDEPLEADIPEPETDTRETRREQPVTRDEDNDTGGSGERTAATEAADSETPESRPEESPGSETDGTVDFPTNLEQYEDFSE